MEASDTPKLTWRQLYFLPLGLVSLTVKFSLLLFLEYFPFPGLNCFPVQPGILPLYVSRNVLK